MLKKTVAILCGVLVAVLVIATVALPVASKVPQTESNTPDAGIFAKAESQTHTIDLDSDVPYVWNGYTMDSVLPIVVAPGCTVMFSAVGGINMVMVAPFGDDEGVEYSSGTLSIIISPSSIKFIGSDSREVTHTYDWGMVLDSSGNYGWYNNPFHTNSLNSLVLVNPSTGDYYTGSSKIGNWDITSTSESGSLYVTEIINDGKNWSVDFAVYALAPIDYTIMVNSPSLMMVIPLLLFVVPVIMLTRSMFSRGD